MCLSLTYFTQHNNPQGSSTLSQMAETPQQAEYYSVVCIYKYVYHIFFIHSFTDGHLDYFCVLAIVANMRVHIFFPVSVFLSFGYIPRSRIVGSYASSIFNLLRNTHAVLHSGFNNLHPHQPCTRTLFSPYPCQHLLSLIFQIMAILTIRR